MSTSQLMLTGVILALGVVAWFVLSKFSDESEERQRALDKAQRIKVRQTAAPAVADTEPRRRSKDFGRR